MSVNVKQHEAFTPPFEMFCAYVNDVKEARKTYNREEFLSLLEAFMVPLTPHLQDVRRSSFPAHQVLTCFSGDCNAGSYSSEQGDE